MRRRDVLAGLVGLGTVGGGAYLLDREGLPVGGADTDGVEPVELRAVEAPGSRAGSVTVPEPGRVTFVEFFATWCDVCAASMPALAAAHDRVGDDVQFLSVTNEPLGHAVTREEIAAWWADHDGSWTVAPDDDLALTEALGASSVPTMVVLDADNVVTWSGTGEHSADEIVERVEAARRGVDG
jgi:thiol-disulfide isomerase/thioredoxin